MNLVNTSGLIGFLAFAIGIIWFPIEKPISVNKTPVGEVYQAELEETKAGLCMACGIAFDGELDCLPRLRPNCPCKQMATLQKVNITERYKSGKSQQHNDVEIINRIGECK